MFYNEKWKSVIGYVGLYEVSNLGRVKSLDKVVATKIKNSSSRLCKGKILVFGFHNFGYPQVTLCDKKGKRKTKTVHRLVAEAFIPNPNKKHCINHKDSNPKNNCVENLEWCTYKENTKHSVLFGNFKPKNGYGKLTLEDAIKIRDMYSNGGFSYKDLGELFNVHKSNIYCIVKNKIWKDLGELK